MVNVKIDFHVHTIYSGDSLIKLDEIIDFAKNRGINGLAITDHNTLKAYDILKKEAIDKEFVIIPGMEIETHIGEVIGLFIDKKIDTKDNNFFNIVQKIKDNNGLVVIPHPFDFLRGNHLKMKLLNDEHIKLIDGIEIMNSRIIFKRCAKKATQFNEKYKFFEVGGSDAHTKKEIGNGYTLIKDVVDKTNESIKEALLAKKSKSMGNLSSPFVHVITVLNKLKKRLYF